MAQKYSRSRFGTEDLAQARRSLASILEKSQTIAEENAVSASRRNLAPVSEETQAVTKRRIERAVRSGSVVLDKFDELHALESSLLVDPLDDLAEFLASLDRLGEILRFLRENCGFAVRELEGTVNYIEEISILDDRRVWKLTSLVNSLKKSVLRSSFDGGLLDEVRQRLENAFRRLIVAVEEDEENRLPVIRNLLQVLERISVNGCLERLSEIYAKIRASAAQTTLKDFKIECQDFQVADWKKRLKFAVKRVFHRERRFCREVFSAFEPKDLWTRCFAEIAARGGILSLLQHGTKIANCKDHSPEQIFNLLKLFGCLIRLRLDFNQLFGTESCAEIQSATRDLIKNIVDRTCYLLWDLGNQTAIVPTIKCCNKLLRDDYRPLISHILAIDQIWRGHHFRENLVDEEIFNQIVCLERNVEEHSEFYDIPAERYVFMMNSHRHFYKHLRGTKLESCLGSFRVEEHNDCTNYYCFLYLRETWAKLPPLLIGRELVLVSRGRSIAKDLIRKRLRSFNEELDEICGRGNFSPIGDEELREKVCRRAIQIVVPVYRSFMQSYGALAERDGRAGMYVKHSAETLENLIRTFFHIKPKLTTKEISVDTFM